MKKSFNCPYCNTNMALVHNSTYFEIYSEFGQAEDSNEIGKDYNIPFDYYENFKESMYNSKDSILIQFFKCPVCDNISIKVVGIGYNIDNLEVNIKPLSQAKVFPNYVPEQIRQDYEEAYSILNLSPKASATLLRRCLQGIIRDCWKDDIIELKNNKLYHEIDAIKDKVSVAIRKAFDDIREIGNIGAHMEEDIDKIINIDPNEAELLLKLIELLIDDWYIETHNQKLLLKEIHDIAKDKKNQKNK